MSCRVTGRVKVKTCPLSRLLKGGWRNRWWMEAYRVGSFPSYWLIDLKDKKAVLAVRRVNVVTCCVE